MKLHPALLPVLLVVSVGPAAAQTVRGSVVEDGSGRAVEAAEVLLLNRGGRAVRRAATDARGVFELAAPEAGRWELLVRRIGYVPYTSRALDLADGSLTTVEIRMGTQAVPVEPLVVVARRTAEERHLADFHARRVDPGRVGGYFLTREDIERRPLATPTQLLLDVPGVSVEPIVTTDNAFGLDRSLIRLPAGRTAGPTGGCAANVWIDGVPTRQSPDHSLDDLLDASQIAGVEVYPRPATAPPQYLRDGACGAVLFWTRRPGGGVGRRGMHDLVGVGLVVTLFAVGMSAVLR